MVVVDNVIKTYYRAMDLPYLKFKTHGSNEISSRDCYA